ncbi:AAA family ATPase, partial [Bacillus amyloliquefaciens]|uniref:AAA family ATPase n=2 Tax=Bacillus amyloliquefaciens group TaxID=1938374 RepID=UPI0021500577
MLERAVTYKNNGQINIILNGQKQVLTNAEAEAEYQAALQKNEAKHSILKEIEKEMNTLVGMEEMKRNIKEIYAWIFVNQKRAEQGLKVGKQALHMMFKGNPGTGKTTVARLIGKLFFEMNVLSKGHLIEAERADLVGEYIGHTAQKTRDLIKKSLGGILFIDEAYSLARGGEKDFGKEAIDTLVKNKVLTFMPLLTSTSLNQKAITHISGNSTQICKTNFQLLLSPLIYLILILIFKRQVFDSLILKNLTDIGLSLIQC